MFTFVNLKITTMNDRLLIFLKKRNLTSAKLAEILKVQSSSISHIIGGRNKPSYDFITKFLEKFPDVNPLWLLLGKGEMFVDNDSDSTQIPSQNKAMTMTPPQISLFDVPHDRQVDFEPEQTENKNTELKSYSQRVSNGNAKSIERIIIFYSDKSFSVYLPE